MQMRVRIREQTDMGGIVVAICCRPPDQEGEVEEVFCNWRNPYGHRPWSSCGTMTTLISSGGTVQEDTNNPGGFWSALLRIF